MQKKKNCASQRLVNIITLFLLLASRYIDTLFNWSGSAPSPLGLLTIMDDMMMNKLNPPVNCCLQLEPTNQDFMKVLNNFKSINERTCLKSYGYQCNLQPMSPPSLFCFPRILPEIFERQLTFWVAKLIYNSTVSCLSVLVRLLENMIFSVVIKDRQLKFLVKILCINEHPVYNSLGSSVCRSCFRNINFIYIKVSWFSKNYIVTFFLFFLWQLNICCISYFVCLSIHYSILWILSSLFNIVAKSMTNM